MLFVQKGPIYHACQFPVALLEACSGVDDPEFGYSRGNPCILVKMNRVCTYIAAAAFLSSLELFFSHLGVTCIKG